MTKSHRNIDPLEVEKLRVLKAEWEENREMPFPQFCGEHFHYDPVMVKWLEGADLPWCPVTERYVSRLIDKYGQPC